MATRKTTAAVADPVENEETSTIESSMPEGHVKVRVLTNYHYDIIGKKRTRFSAGDTLTINEQALPKFAGKLEKV